MSREAHVRFWERAVVKFRRATRLIVFGEAHLRRILGRMPHIIMHRGFIARWTRMPHSTGRLCLAG